MDLISILFSTTSIAIIIYFFIYSQRNRKNNSIFTEVNTGYRCYSCKFVIGDPNKVSYIIGENPNFDEKLCKCNECNRNDKLSLLVKRSKYNIYLSLNH